MNWHLAQVRAQTEKAVEGRMREIGLDAYCPRETVWRPQREAEKRRLPAMLRKGSAIVPVTRPYLPGYVFFGADREALAYAVKPLDVLGNGIDGIVRALRYADAGRLVVVPTAFVEDMRAAEARGAMERRAGNKGRVSLTGWHVDVADKDPDEVKRRIKQGQQVRITSGPFAQFQAKVKGYRNTDRIVVLLSMFGGTSEVVVSEDMVERV